MDVRAYLDRIGYQGNASPTIETLREMHQAHFLNVPFENLDIARGVRIEMDEAGNFAKVVKNRRGGWCFELTGLFAMALRELGFQVDLLGARTLFEGRLGHPMDHMILIVHLEEDWIADVGFGSRVAEPLRLSERQPQFAAQRRYVVENDGDHWFVTCTEPGTGAGVNPNAMYIFTMQPRVLDEFGDVCNWLQTSPDSRFVQRDIVTLPTATGRVTLAGGRLITIDDGNRNERQISSPDEERKILQDRFGITLS
jgi:N-hydroxyarylamine O-acetyltransferase